MQVFVLVVEAGSLTGAAERLGLAVPSVVRSLASLERELGARLLHRTTRRSSLSDEGREYYASCKRVLAEVEAADAILSARRAKPAGRLRVTAPVTYGRLHVAQVVIDYAQRYPQVDLELLLLDRVVDLIEEGIDVAVRIGVLADSTLVARSIGSTRRIVCAAPDYLRRAGTPTQPEQLAAHRCIRFTGLNPGVDWSFGGRGARRVTIHPALTTNQLDVALQACLQGLGCAQFLCYQVQAPLDEGRLVRVLGDFESDPLPVQLVYPGTRLVSASLRAFVDLAARAAPLSPAPAPRSR